MHIPKVLFDRRSSFADRAYALDDMGMGPVDEEYPVAEKFLDNDCSIVLDARKAGYVKASFLDRNGKTLDYNVFDNARGLDDFIRRCLEESLDEDMQVPDIEDITDGELKIYPYSVGYTREHLDGKYLTFISTSDNRLLFQFSKYKDAMKITVFDKQWDSPYYAFLDRRLRFNSIYSYSGEQVQAVVSILKKAGITERHLKRIYNEIVMTGKYFK